jgi:hypothetical protein
VPCTSHFTFDMTGALADQLEAVLPTLTPEALTVSDIDRVDASPGVYQLYQAESLVYIGKADDNLKGRLHDHHRKISGRLNIALSDMSFTGLYLEGTWIPVGPEQMLINRWKRRVGEEPLWNTNGFGMNDPGRERDTTNFKESHFDVLYPAKQLKNDLPYVFRYENQWAKHPDYLVSQVDISRDSPTAMEALQALISALPHGWQLTVLPGYVILYKEVRRFPSARYVLVR